MDANRIAAQIIALPCGTPDVQMRHETMTSARKVEIVAWTLAGMCAAAFHFPGVSIWGDLGNVLWTGLIAFVTAAVEYLALSLNRTLVVTPPHQPPLSSRFMPSVFSVVRLFAHHLNPVTVVNDSPSIFARP